MTRKTKTKPTVQQVYAETIEACVAAGRADLLERLLKHMADEQRQTIYVAPRCP